MFRCCCLPGGSATNETASGTISVIEFQTAGNIRASCGHVCKSVNRGQGPCCWCRTVPSLSSVIGYSLSGQSSPTASPSRTAAGAADEYATPSAESMCPSCRTRLRSVRQVMRHVRAQRHLSLTIQDTIRASTSDDSQSLDATEHIGFTI